MIGFDIERRPYPAQLVLQDVTTLDGRQFRDATLIVASPPCQAYSYRAMPWKRAKVLPPPDNTLFEACFRIQREASEAAGRHIPMVVENVRGAQKWVGRARANFGSYYLWGDVAMVGRKIMIQPEFGAAALFSPTRHIGVKAPGLNWSDRSKRGQDFTRHAGRHAAGIKVASGGGWWHDSTNNLIRKASSKSNAHKQASALIAKIPFPLAQFVARVFKQGVCGV